MPSDPQDAGSSAPQPPAPEPLQPAATAVQCCAQMDPKSAGACTLCTTARICKNCRAVVNGKNVCQSCKQQILAELEAEQAAASHLPLAFVLGAVAAVVSGVIWAAIAVTTHVQIGYVAIGVGYLAGQGVYFGGGKRKGVNLQYAAVVCALLGLFLGKLFTGVGFVVNASPGTLSYFEPQVYSWVFNNIDKLLSPFDFLWVFIALRMAWRIPKPAEIRIK